MGLEIKPQGEASQAATGARRMLMGVRKFSVPGSLSGLLDSLGKRYVKVAQKISHSLFRQ